MSKENFMHLSNKGKFVKVTFKNTRNENTVNYAILDGYEQSTEGKAIWNFYVLFDVDFIYKNNNAFAPDYSIIDIEDANSDEIDEMYKALDDKKMSWNNEYLFWTYKSNIKTNNKYKEDLIHVSDIAKKHKKEKWLFSLYNSKQSNEMTNFEFFPTGKAGNSKMIDVFNLFDEGKTDVIFIEGTYKRYYPSEKNFDAVLIMKNNDFKYVNERLLIFINEDK